jgi:protein phosphatase
VDRGRRPGPRGTARGSLTRRAARAVDAVPPHGRTAVFLGDLVDRGPDSPGVIQLVMGMGITDPDSVTAGIAWWEELTGRGGEGMVVKPYANLARAALTRDGRGLAQPGIKVRGREYLRIIYGPDYTEPANLARLRDRHLGRKRSLALREYALGLEALERGARGDPLWRIHEAVFGVLALESEPVDPRL